MPYFSVYISDKSFKMLKDVSKRAGTAGSVLFLKEVPDEEMITRFLYYGLSLLDERYPERPGK